MAKKSSSLKRLNDELAKKKGNDEINRRKFIYGFGIVLSTLAVAPAIAYRKDISQFAKEKGIIEATFDDARKNENLRQQFLDSLVNGINIPYCDGVVYDPDGKGIIGFYKNEIKILGENLEDVSRIIGRDLASIRKGDFDLKTPDVLNLSGQGRKTKIFVGKRVFENPFLFKTPDELEATIVKHEGRHAKQYGEFLPYLNREEIIDMMNQGKLSPQTLYTIYEYDALAHELTSYDSGKFNLSEDFVRGRKKVFLNEGFNLTNRTTAGISEFEKDVIMKTHEYVFQTFPNLKDVSL